MIFNLFSKSTAPDAAASAYRSIVAQSRQERFYAEWDVPDTPTGRFNMITLHITLLLHRLRGERGARVLSQSLVDLFFEDMDHSHRELGVTDLGVPRQVRRVGDYFYGLMRAVSDALDAGNASVLEAVLSKNLYGGVASAGTAPLATYLLAERARLDTQPTAILIAGQLPQGLVA